MKESTKNKLMLAMGSVILVGSSYIAGSVNNKNESDIKPSYTIEETAELTKDDIKLLKVEDVVNELKTVSNLETMQINANVQFKVTLAKEKWRIFQKERLVKFYGLGRYYLDVDSMDNSNVLVDHVNNKIILLLEEDNYYIDSYILEEKTEFQDVYDGTLAWYKFNIPMEDSYILEFKAKEQLLQKYKGKEFMQLFKESTEKSLSAVFSTLLNTDYTVEVRFI